jgi:N-acetylmuramoyl-L-alanine amidase CwlA
MKVIQNLVPASKYNIKCPYPMTPEFIVVHNTANDANAANEVAYMIRNDNKVSFHYAVDDKAIVQGIPEDRNAWHAGDGTNGRGNRKGLSIEICYSKSGGQRFIEAEKLTAKFIAYKLKEKGWGIDRVKKHQDFSGKYCPHRTLDMGWQRFLDMVKSELDKLKGGATVAEKNVPSSWAKDAWEWAKKEGLLDGTRPKDNLTREEFAVVLKRLADKK